MKKVATRCNLPFSAKSQLGALVSAEYVAQGLSDEDFARIVCAKLPFSVTANNVTGIRRALGIPSTLEARREAAAKEKAVKAEAVAAVMSKADVRELVDQIAGLAAAIGGMAERVARLERLQHPRQLLLPVVDAPPRHKSQGYAGAQG